MKSGEVGVAKEFASECEWFCEMKLQKFRPRRGISLRMEVCDKIRLAIVNAMALVHLIRAILVSDPLVLPLLNSGQLFTVSHAILTVFRRLAPVQ